MGTAELGGDYFTSGTTRIETGTLHHSGKAEQSAGVYELWAGGTAKVTGADGLRIRNGGIVGIGKVEGNLKLGYTDAEAALAPGVAAAVQPYIRPGIAGVNNGIGTLTITGVLQILSSRAEIVINSHVVSGCSQIAVQGAAALNGNLRLSGDYTSKSGDVGGLVFNFMTYASRTGDFIIKDWTQLWLGKESPDGMEISVDFIPEVASYSAKVKLIDPKAD